MMREMRVKLRKVREGQVVTIPAALALPGDFAILRQTERGLILETPKGRSLLAALSTLPPLREEFAPIADEPPTSS
jgi:virulence-associated protein VagC